jgi:hypothetical protein
MRCVFIHLSHLFSLCLLLVCWVREIFSGGPGHIFSLCDSAVWSVGPVQFMRGIAWIGWRDCTGFFLVWLCCSGYGTVEIVGGVVCFFLFSLVVVRFLGCWIFSVGYLCHILRFSSVNLWFFSCGFRVLKVTDFR